MRTDDDIVDAVAIDIACCRNADAGHIAGCIAANDEPVGSRQRRQIDGPACAATLAVDDIGFAGAIATVIAASCTDDQIADAITIDVACIGYAVPGHVARRIALNPESFAGENAGQIDQPTRGSALAIDDIGLPGIGAAIVSATGPDDDVADPVAIDIACARYTAARQIACRIATDDEPVAGSQAGEVDRGAGRACLAINHIGLPGVGTSAIAIAGANDEIVDAIAIDIPGNRHAEPGIIIGRSARDKKTVAGGQGRKVDDLRWHNGLRLYGVGTIAAKNITLMTLASRPLRYRHNSR